VLRASLPGMYLMYVTRHIWPIIVDLAHEIKHKLPRKIYIVFLRRRTNPSKGLPLNANRFPEMDCYYALDLSH
jgi:hypothetical protein